MKKQSLGALISMAGSLVLLAIGFLRIGDGGLTWNDFTNSINEYGLHIFAGLFFGWALYVGVADAFRRELKMNTLALQIIAVASPILFLIVIHQTRNTLNDGPATIALALSFFLTAAATGAFGERK